MDNLGLLYNKEFFNHLVIDLQGRNTNNEKVKKNKHFYFPEKKEERRNGNRRYTEITQFGKFLTKITTNSKLRDGNKFVPNLEKTEKFTLKTLYPGLLFGSGYSHEIGQNPDEFQLGFYFDHTTGLPVINGSSIKGMLKAGCKSRKGYITEILLKILTGEDKLPKDFDEDNFIKTVFEGKDLSIYQRDIFHDAFPISSEKSLFGSDYITHHENPLKNPNPVQFLRVQPEVTYQFQFDLKPTNGLKAEQKLELFKQIILDLGLGAKTNVGYGQFDTI